MSGRIYVERRMRCDLDSLWRRTQDPADHQRWDVRFTWIDYLPAADGQPQRFRYATRVLPGVVLEGVGETAGEHRQQEGTATSALRFWSDDPRSLIHDGSGYWQYVQSEDAVRFLTAYDYRTRWGALGRAADFVFRPLIGWATAWSFDRLGLWLERGITPDAGLRRALARGATQLGLALWGARLLRGQPVVGAALVAAAVAAGRVADDRVPTARRCLRTPP